MLGKIALLSTVSILVSGQIPDSTRRLLDYSHSLPLNLTQRLIDKNARVRIFDIEYDSPRGGRVTGYLIEPVVAGRFAGVVFGHWGEGNRTEFLPEAIRYSGVGAVCVLIDYPWARPEPWRRKVYGQSTTAQQDRDLLAQAVIDLRRAIDLLLERQDVDRRRIAYVGHSYGAQFGAILSAVDQRMSTAILMAGVGKMEDLWFDSNDPDEVELRQAAGVDALRKEYEVTSVLDAIRFVRSAAPVSLFFQFARFDRFSTESMREYAKAANGRKKIDWYPTGHALNDPQALIDRARWLEKEIRLVGAVGAMAGHQMQ